MNDFRTERTDLDDFNVFDGAELIGWIERGEACTNLRTNWTEWRFTPAYGSAVLPIRRGFIEAREDARKYAQARHTHTEGDNQ